jgi:prenyl protein peptidase
VCLVVDRCPLKVIYTLVYVLPFYLSSTTRPSRALSRDAPSVIRARITSVTLTCVICSVATFVILTSKGQATNADALHSMGYWPAGLVATAKTLLLTAILFAGPLYETLVVHGAWRDWLSLQPVTELFSEWTTWRNIIAVGFTF